VAEEQAMAVTELVAHAATSRGTEPREILFTADDYSAVCMVTQDDDEGVIHGEHVRV
jgi:hypothetical protein